MLITTLFQIAKKQKQANVHHMVSIKRNNVLVTGYNIDEFRKTWQVKETTIKGHISYDYIYMKYPEKANL